MKVYNINHEENSKLVASKNLKYELTYFELQFCGTSGRALLAYGGADWTPLYPDWEVDKTNTPFETVPILKIIENGEGEAGR
ncbi:hypothetical protein BGZ99_000429, partial [Dissophora globulifera]